MAPATDMATPEFAKGRPDLGCRILDEATQHAAAVLETEEENFVSWLDDHRLKAWLDAYDKLMTWPSRLAH